MAAYGFLDGHFRVRRLEAYRRHAVLVENLDTARRNSVCEGLVEIGSRNLEGIFPPSRELRGKIKVACPVAAFKHRAVFAHEALLLDAFQQVSFLQQVHAVRKQTFADDKSREALLLDDQQPKAFTMQPGCRR